MRSGRRVLLHPAQLPHQSFTLDEAKSVEGLNATPSVEAVIANPPGILHKGAGEMSYSSDAELERLLQQARDLNAQLAVGEPQGASSSALGSMDQPQPSPIVKDSDEQTLEEGGGEFEEVYSGASGMPGEGQAMKAAMKRARQMLMGGRESGGDTAHGEEDGGHRDGGGKRRDKDETTKKSAKGSAIPPVGGERASSDALARELVNLMLLKELRGSSGDEVDEEDKNPGVYLKAISKSEVLIKHRKQNPKIIECGRREKHHMMILTAVQDHKLTKQYALNGGQWNAAWELTVANDPCGRPIWGGSTFELFLMEDMIKTWPEIQNRCLGGLGRLLAGGRRLLVLGWCLGGSGRCIWIFFWRFLDGFGRQNGLNFDPNLKTKRWTSRS